MPDFGVEQPNVDRRISVFHTTELPEPKSEAPQWIEDNPITQSQQERFYEKPFNEVTKKQKIAISHKKN